jgi:hypothetical protein
LDNRGAGGLDNRGAGGLDNRGAGAPGLDTDQPRVGERLKIVVPG